MSQALVLRKTQELSIDDVASTTWLVYVRQDVDVMIDVSVTSDLRTYETALARFRGHGDVYAVPV